MAKEAKRGESPRGEDFGALLQYLMEERGFTIQEISRRTDYDSGYLSRVARGKIPISFEAVCRLADVLRQSTAEMLIAAGKLPRDFPYGALTEEGRRACLKLAEGRHLTREEKDGFLKLFLPPEDIPDKDQGE